MRYYVQVLVLLLSGFVLVGCETTGTNPGRYFTETVSTRAGKEVLLTAFSQVLPDCANRRLPTVRVISRPSHGVVSFVQGEGKLTVGRTYCTSGKVPKLGVFYTPTAHFSGTDTIEVVASGILKGDYERIKFLVKVSK